MYAEEQQAVVRDDDPALQDPVIKQMVVQLRAMDSYGTYDTWSDARVLDPLVLTREPLHPGVIVRFRPIGFLKMLDNGEHDEKVIGVPTDKLDPTYAGIRDLQDLPLIERQRIEAFFRVYKDLPEGRNPVQLDGWGNAAEAKALIRASMQRFDLQQQRRKGD